MSHTMTMKAPARCNQDYRTTVYTAIMYDCILPNEQVIQLLGREQWGCFDGALSTA